jgi:hypothetical protein
MLDSNRKFMSPRSYLISIFKIMKTKGIYQFDSLLDWVNNTLIVFDIYEKNNSVQFPLKEPTDEEIQMLLNRI